MTQKKTYRIAQVNRLLQEEIASLLLTEMQDERLQRLTITEVRTKKDLKHAIVFASTREPNDPDGSIGAANKSAGYIRKLLYNRIRIKHVPELEFRYDESLDRAERIFKTLNEMDLDIPDEGETEDQ